MIIEPFVARYAEVYIYYAYEHNVGKHNKLEFLNRFGELKRLEALSARPSGGFAVIWGRRRVGKTRLLLEWVRRKGGVYFVADQSAAPLQRRALAEALGSRLQGFAEVVYPDWASLLSRAAAEAARLDWRGPLVLDEFPYLVDAAPELPSVLQRWLDHEAAKSKLITAISGSSRRMMQGLILDRHAPLFGRAVEAFRLSPLEPGYLQQAFPGLSSVEAVSYFAAWGGVPRYWELMSGSGARSLEEAVDTLVLDPQGALHQEPDRLLLEETPSAMALRPLLEVIGLGAHRLTEMAGRLGIPVTSLSRPMARLVEMDLVRRENPFGETEKAGNAPCTVSKTPFSGCGTGWLLRGARYSPKPCRKPASAFGGNIRMIWRPKNGKTFAEGPFPFFKKAPCQNMVPGSRPAGGGVARDRNGISFLYPWTASTSCSGRRSGGLNRPDCHCSTKPRMS